MTLDDSVLIGEHDVVSVRESINPKITSDICGTIVHAYSGGNAYEVEFFDKDRQTIRV